jgi:hypothetical protein
MDLQEGFMKTGILASLVVSAILCLVAQASALDFSADVVMLAAGHTTSSKIFAKDSKVRMETKGHPSYSIIRDDVLWTVMPDQKSYTEMKIDPSQRPKTEEKVRGEVSRKLIGSEKIDGHSTQKYEVTYREGEKTSKMYQWMATDIKFPVKMAAADGTWTVEYKNIKMGSQPSSLFEVPSGYKKMTMPAFPGMPGTSGMPKDFKLPRK